MHTEIQVALRFVISFLYNKLPRRRVNLFGEELEAALRDKFQGHWYPDKPFKGSAYRCLKITDPADPVLNRAARESGNPVADIIENLPADLAVWIDPGEVSYRMGEKGAVKILYSEKESAAATVPNGGGGNALIINNEEMMVSSPAAEVRGFLTLDCSLTSSFNGLSLSQNGFNGQQQQHHGGGGINGNNGGGGTSPLVSPPVLPQPAAAVVTPPGVPVANPFQPRQPPVVYTAATFAQTKFGSTKLKTNSKKPNRMSPTEFSNYIKQRALQKSLQQQQQQISVNYGSSNNINGSGSNSPPGSGGGPQQQQQQHNGFFDKFYGSQQSSSGSSYFHNNMNNYNNMSAGANTFHKSLSSPGGNSGGGSNDFGLPLSSNQNLLLSPSSLSLGTGGFSLSDYTSLLADCWPDDEAETKNILEDILASAGSGTGSTNKHTAREQFSSYGDWLTGSPLLSTSINFNTTPPETHGLGPDSRSSSTKSMTSLASDSLPTPPPASAKGPEAFNQRVLVAN